MSVPIGWTSRTRSSGYELRKPYRKLEVKNAWKIESSSLFLTLCGGRSPCWHRPRLDCSCRTSLGILTECPWMWTALWPNGRDKPCPWQDLIIRTCIFFVLFCDHFRLGWPEIPEFWGNFSLTLLRIFKVVHGRWNEHGTHSVAFQRLKEFKWWLILILFNPIENGNQISIYSEYALNHLQENTVSRFAGSRNSRAESGRYSRLARISEPAGVLKEGANPSLVSFVSLFLSHRVNSLSARRTSL